MANMAHEEIRKNDPKLLFEIVKARYKARLTSEELEEVQKSVTMLLEVSESLMSVKLENWDEPFTVFKPIKGEKKK